MDESRSKNRCEWKPQEREAQVRNGVNEGTEAPGSSDSSGRPGLG